MAATLLLTRPAPAARAFAARTRWGGPVVVAPLLRIVLHPFALPDDGAEVIFTAAHAVTALAQATPRRDWPVWCVGPATAQAAREAGFDDLTEGGGDAGALVAQLRAAPPGRRLVHLCGDHVARDIAAELRAAGLPALAQVVYAQQPLALSEQARACLQAPGAVVTPVFSPRSARLLADALARLNLRAALHVVAISPAAAAPLRGMAVAAPTIAARPDAEAMLSALAGLQAALEPGGNPR